MRILQSHLAAARSARPWRVVPNSLVHGRSLPWAVSVLLLILLALQLAQLGRPLLNGPRALAAPDVGPTLARSPGVDIEAIVSAHIFGTTDGSDAAGDPAEVAASQLPLVLSGTIALAQPELGFAIVGDSPATGKLYAVGRQIGAGVTLRLVYADRIVVDRGGTLEAILLPRKSGGAAPAQVALTTPSSEPIVGEALQSLIPPEDTEITDLVRMRPVMANGEMRGLRVSPGQSIEQFSQLGVRRGDLLTAINGMPLDDPARTTQALQTINSGSAVNVTVERDGATLQLQIGQEALAAVAAAPSRAPTPPASGQPVLGEMLPAQ